MTITGQPTGIQTAIQMLYKRLEEEKNKRASRSPSCSSTPVLASAQIADIRCVWSRVLQSWVDTSDRSRGNGGHAVSLRGFL